VTNKDVASNSHVLVSLAQSMLYHDDVGCATMRSQCCNLIAAHPVYGA
jgi:hypothetical protein